MENITKTNLSKEKIQNKNTIKTIKHPKNQNNSNISIINNKRKK